MWRAIGSVVAGLVTWAFVATILNWGLRTAIPDYHAAETTLQFTMAMKAGRLALAAAASLCAGIAARLVAPDSRWSPWIVGVVILGMFLPIHMQLWSKFPAWYHLTFLLSIVPLVLIGAALAGRNRTVAPAR